MKQADAKKYIKKLGLEKAHNGIKQTNENEPMLFECEAKLMLFALQTVTKYAQRYGNRFKVTMYILKKDGTAYLCYNDEIGINMTQNISLEYAQEHVKLCSPEEEYLLMVETDENLFSFVTQV